MTIRPVVDWNTRAYARRVVFVRNTVTIPGSFSRRTASKRQGIPRRVHGVSSRIDTACAFGMPMMSNDVKCWEIMGCVHAASFPVRMRCAFHAAWCTDCRGVGCVCMPCAFSVHGMSLRVRTGCTSLWGFQGIGGTCMVCRLQLTWCDAFVRHLVMIV